MQQTQLLYENKATLILDLFTKCYHP